MRTAPGQAPPAATPDSNNRVDPSPYYPVFGRRMVMISYARRLPNLAWRRGWCPCGVLGGFERDSLGRGRGPERALPRARRGTDKPGRCPEHARSHPRRPAPQPARLLALRARRALKAHPVNLVPVGGLAALETLIWLVNVAPDARVATFQVSRIPKAGQRGGENCQLTLCSCHCQKDWVYFRPHTVAKYTQ
jgi:hypothetical protein